jgi:hypothetical protein
VSASAEERVAFWGWSDSREVAFWGWGAIATVIPTETLLFTINEGAASTDDNDVLLHVVARNPDGLSPVSMRFSEDTVTWGDWMAYSEEDIPYQLSPQTVYPSQPKAVFVEFSYE